MELVIFFLFQINSRYLIGDRVTVAGVAAIIEVAFAELLSNAVFSELKAE